MINFFSTYKKVSQKDIEITGFTQAYGKGPFDRLYGIDKTKCSTELKTLSCNTAGGRVRIRTNSKTMKVHVVLNEFISYSHVTACGTSGLDVYVGMGDEKHWIDSIIPLYGQKDIERIIRLSGKMQDVTINLPLYAGVDKFEVQIEKGALLEKPSKYMYEKPIVFYGSSITQGCSASRPGNSFPEIVTRKLDANLMNFGFSSGAKGETIVAQYIASIPMSAMIVEYDHNAETIEHLKNTHMNFVKVIRNANPELPIIILSRFSGGISIAKDETEKRRDIVKSTYEIMRDSGDKNIFFIDGLAEMQGKRVDDYFVDGVHPTDYGMYLIADIIYKKMKEIL